MGGARPKREKGRKQNWAEGPKRPRCTPNQVCQASRKQQSEACPTQGSPGVEKSPDPCTCSLLPPAPSKEIDVDPEGAKSWNLSANHTPTSFLKRGSEQHMSSSASAPDKVRHPYRQASVTDKLLRESPGIPEPQTGERTITKEKVDSDLPSPHRTPTFPFYFCSSCQVWCVTNLGRL